MSEATKQRKASCASCPWVMDGDRTCHFDPKVLKNTVVKEMEKGGIHPCHSNEEYMCSGYLAFAEKNLRYGVDSLQLVRIYGRLSGFDYEKVNKRLNVFSSVKEMLADHRLRMKSILGSQKASEVKVS